MRQKISFRLFTISSIIFVLLLFVLRDILATPQGGWLGVQFQELTPTLKEELKVGNRTGLLINDVVACSPADKADLMEGDVILSFNGKPVEKTAEFVELVSQVEPGTKVEIKYLRKGIEEKTSVTMGKKKRPAQKMEKMIFYGNPKPRLGVSVTELSTELAEYFKVEAGKGVLVLKVIEGTPAKKAQLKPGDVITKIADQEVSDQEELVKALSDFDEDTDVAVHFVRKGKTGDVNVKLEKAEDDDVFYFKSDDNKSFHLPDIYKRFDREIEFNMPDHKKQLEILREKNKTSDDTISL